MSFKKQKGTVFKDIKEIQSLNFLNDQAIKEIELGNYLKAINLLKEIIKRKPDYLLAYYNLGNLYMSLEDFQKGKIYFEKAIVIDPLHAKSYLGLAICLSRLGKKEQAIKYYHKAYQLDKTIKKISLPNDLFLE